MNVMEEIFEIRSCIEILANDIQVNTADEYMRLKGRKSPPILPTPRSFNAPAQGNPSKFRDKTCS